jgi:hypothetical protein
MTRKELRGIIYHARFVVDSFERDQAMDKKTLKWAESWLKPTVSFSTTWGYKPKDPTEFIVNVGDGNESEGEVFGRYTITQLINNFIESDWEMFGMVPLDEQAARAGMLVAAMQAGIEQLNAHIKKYDKACHDESDGPDLTLIQGGHDHEQT